jgi:hypothetical protein
LPATKTLSHPRRMEVKEKAGKAFTLESVPPATRGSIKELYPIIAYLLKIYNI